MSVTDGAVRAGAWNDAVFSGPPKVAGARVSNSDAIVTGAGAVRSVEPVDALLA